MGTIGLGLQALATNTLGLLVKQGLDANGRPKAFYKNVHMNCPHLSAFEAGHMVKTMSDKDGCRFSMGCKGPRSACDSFERKWNNGVNWCVNNATCIGCTSPTFPDRAVPLLRPTRPFSGREAAILPGLRLSDTLNGVSRSSRF